MGTPFASTGAKAREILNQAFIETVIDEATLNAINGHYVCQPDAGPAWREACRYGHDMSLVEYNLKLTPEQRLEQRQRALNMILDLTEAKPNAPE